MAQSLSLIILLLTWASGPASGESFETMTSHKSSFNLKLAAREEHHRSRRSTDFGAAEQLEILNLHNQFRSNVTPEAANMKFMDWDDSLATMAQQWSEECLFEHGQPDNISPFNSLGQNLWIGSGGGYSETNKPSVTGPIYAWHNEVQHYTYDTRACAKVCGHYTQIVWASSYALGCGRAFCPTVPKKSGQYTNAWIVTCNYGPPGNYQGAHPYKDGPSCSQCDSGIGQCYNNQCRLCSDHNEKCACALECKNCGVLQSDCTCRCQDGWYGTDCSTYCEDTHEYCGKSPGWPGPSSCSLSSAVPKGCPLMCGVCNAEDPDFICDRDMEVEYGVSLTLIHDISQWSYINLGLRDIIGSVTTDTCNTAQHITSCCPSVTGYTSSVTLPFVDGDHVTIVSGYPKAVDATSYVVLVAVRPPVTSELCSTSGQSTRRKRETDEVSVFLDQDVLLEAIQQNKAKIEQELDVTVSEVYKGESGGGGLSGGVIFLIILLVLLLVAGVAAAVYFVVIKGKQGQRISQDKSATNRGNQGIKNEGMSNIKC